MIYLGAHIKNLGVIPDSAFSFFLSIQSSSKLQVCSLTKTYLESFPFYTSVLCYSKPPLFPNWTNRTGINWSSCFNPYPISTRYLYSSQVGLWNVKSDPITLLFKTLLLLCLVFRLECYSPRFCVAFFFSLLRSQFKCHFLKEKSLANPFQLTRFPLLSCVAVRKIKTSIPSLWARGGQATQLWPMKHKLKPACGLFYFILPSWNADRKLVVYKFLPRMAEQGERRSLVPWWQHWDTISAINWKTQTSYFMRKITSLFFKPHLLSFLVIRDKHNSKWFLKHNPYWFLSSMSHSLLYNSYPFFTFIWIRITNFTSLLHIYPSQLIIVK